MQRQAQRQRSFRMSWLRLYAVMGSLTFLGTFILVGMGWGIEVVLGMPALLLGQLLFQALFALWLCQSYPIRVTPEGLTAMTFWGKRASLPWEEIEGARPRSFLFLPHLVVSSKTRGITLWVPLFVGDQPDFVTALQEHVPEDSPVRQALRI